MSGAKKVAIGIGVYVALFLIIGFFPQDCAICDGQGVHPCFVSAEYHLGADCPYCQGTGNARCEQCDGTGSVCEFDDMFN